MSSTIDDALARGRYLKAVERSAILARLINGPPAPLVVIRAPAGFGKSTLMSQWAGRVGACAYLRLTGSDDDPAVLMQNISGAASAIAPVHEDVAHRISGRALEPGLQAASRLADAVSGIEGPALLMLDDIHVLQDRRATDALTVFIDLLPPGLRVVVAGHDASALHLARMRAADRPVEVSEAELAFGVEETGELAQLLGVELSDDDVAMIVEETGGWPIAISLALHSFADTNIDERARQATIVRSIADYIRAELLEPLDQERRSWLLRSSALEVMTGPLCDDALETTGSLAQLRDLQHSSLLVQPIDPEATRYRYHPLLRTLLRDVLEEDSPGEAQRIAARAARWHDAEGDSLAALEYALVSEDRELAAGLVARHVWPLHWSGRIATLERYVQWFDQDGIRERFPSIAVLAGFIYTIDGRRHEGEFWLAVAESAHEPAPMPDGSKREAWVAMLRGMLARDGVEAVEADAKTAEDGMRGDSPFMPGVRLLSAVASLLSGRATEAFVLSREAMELAAARGAMPGFAMATGLAAALALREGRGPIAAKFVEDGLDKLRAAGLDDYVLCCLLHAVAARVAASSGRSVDARHHLAHVHRLRPLTTASAPWLSVPLRLEAIHALITMGDGASARTLMREVDDILRVRPALGMLATDAGAMRARLAAIPGAGGGQWTLTAAELRVLQYLPTHLTFGEIAERLYVSPHTVKSQAVAIYSKLGVSSRRLAIEAAVESGLLDDSALRFPLDSGVSEGIG